MKFNPTDFSSIFKKTPVFILAATFFFSFHVMAQGKKMPEAIKKMEKLLGKWEGSVLSETGPVVTKRALTVSLDISRSLKNLGIQLNSKVETFGQSAILNGYGTIGYDTANNELHLMIIYDSGTVYELTGNWVNDNNLFFTGNTVRNGTKIGINLRLGSKIPGELEYSFDTTIGSNMLIADKGKLMKKNTVSNTPPKKNK